MCDAYLITCLHGTDLNIKFSTNITKWEKMATNCFFHHAYGEVIKTLQVKGIFTKVMKTIHL